MIFKKFFIACNKTGSSCVMWLKGENTNYIHKGVVFMKKHKALFLTGGMIVLIAAVALAVGIYLKQPASYLLLDVNPSIEIQTDRLDQVIAVTPLNEDAKALLAGFALDDDDIDDVIEKIVDRMVFFGYINGGDDSQILISVKDDKISESLLRKVNGRIEQYLQKRQLRSEVTYQKLQITDEDIKTAKENHISVGRVALVKQIMEKTDLYDEQTLLNASVSALKQLAAENGVTAGTGTDIAGGIAVISFEEAKQIALETVPGALITDVELDRKKGTLVYEIELYQDLREIELVIDAATGALLKQKEEPADDNAKLPEIPSDYISPEEAKQIALKKAAANAVITEFEVDRDDGKFVYEMELYADQIQIEAEIDAQTGAIIKWKEKNKQHGTVTPAPANPSATEAPDSANTTVPSPVTPTNPEASAKISAEEAKQIALRKAPAGAVITDFDLDHDDGRWIYEIELHSGSTEIEADIDAATGAVIKWEEDIDDDEDDLISVPNLPISAEEAKQIAQSKAPAGAVITDFDLDKDDGRWVYEIELRKGNLEYEAKIDANTGAVIKWEAELDD